MYDLNDEISTVFRSKMQQSCFPQKCCECGSVIDCGETHEHALGVWGGTICVFKTCESCVDAREKVLKDIEYENEIVFCGWDSECSDFMYNEKG